MALTLTVLGSSGTYAGPGNACSGYLVTAGSTRFLMDCGPGTLSRLGEHLDPAALDAVVLSHSHPDHWLELPVLCNAWRYALERDGLPVHATAETRAMCERILPGGIGDTFDWHVITETSEVVIAGQRWRFSATDHPVETLAPRVDVDGRSLAFSSDTGPDWSFERLGPGIDLAICESTFLSDREPERVPHLSARQAGAMARDAGVGRLVLSHLMPGEDPPAHRAEAEAAFGREVTVSRVHDSFEV